MHLKTIAEQVIVVFGASSGIGREIALRFARRGAKVVVAARTESALHSLVKEIERFGGESIYQIADAADFEQVMQVADIAVNRFGRIDTWAHVAGTAVIGPFAQTTPEEFKRVIEVNLLGQAYGAMVALPFSGKYWWIVSNLCLPLRLENDLHAILSLLLENLVASRCFIEGHTVSDDAGRINFSALNSL